MQAERFFYTHNYPNHSLLISFVFCLNKKIILPATTLLSCVILNFGIRSFLSTSIKEIKS